MNIPGATAVTAVRNVVTDRRQGGPQSRDSGNQTRDTGSSNTAESKAKTTEASSNRPDASAAAQIQDPGAGQVSPVKAAGGVTGLDPTSLDTAVPAVPVSEAATHQKTSSAEASAKSGGTEAQINLSAMARQTAVDGNTAMRAYGR